MEAYDVLKGAGKGKEKYGAGGVVFIFLSALAYSILCYAMPLSAHPCVPKEKPQLAVS